ncbi:MAG: hypothetical protein R3C55_05880 [Parvularculaceae bacterium]
MQAGDLVLTLPHGARHRLSSSADVVEAELLTDILRPPRSVCLQPWRQGAAVKLVAGGSVWDDASKTAIARLLP